MTTPAKERPILFSGPMVRAILDGRKTVTRRVIKPQESIHGPCDDGRLYWIPPGMQGDPDPNCPTIFAESTCPFGDPGDRLWVRETHSFSTEKIPLIPPAGRVQEMEQYANHVWYSADNDRPTWAETKWRPSIFMPRWASRITLEVKSITAERLQDITEEDAEREGVQRIELAPGPDFGVRHGIQMRGHPMTSTYRDAFAKLWEEINGRGSWAANSWVWRIESERVNPAISAK